MNRLRSLHTPTIWFAALLAQSITLTYQDANAQTHFNTCVSRTSESAIIIIPPDAAPSINGSPLEAGDEIALITPDGLCAGAGVWGGNAAFSIWGSDEYTQTGGYALGDSLEYIVWDASEGQEYANVKVSYSNAEQYLRSTPTYLASAIYEVTGLTAEGQADTTLARHEIPLAMGWNVISSYVLPQDSDIKDVFSPILDDLAVVKDEQGGIFSPELEVDGINKWHVGEAYKVYMMAPASLVIRGAEVVPETTQVFLEKGWNMIPYLRKHPMQVEEALSAIAEEVIALKDDAGSIYLPGSAIDLVGTLQPGAGYMIYVENDAVLNYPANAQPVTDALVKSNLRSVAPTPGIGSSAHIIVRGAGVPDGTVLSAWSNATKVGEGVVAAGVATILVRGEDPYQKLPSAGEGDDLKIKMDVAGRLVDVQAKQVVNSLNGLKVASITFETDGVWLVDIGTGPSDIVEELQLDQNFPNPFQLSTTIGYSLPAAGQVKLEVFNVLGQRVQTLIDEQQPAGNHRTAFDAAGLPAGLYFYKITFDGSTITKKMLLLK